MEVKAYICGVSFVVMSSEMPPAPRITKTSKSHSESTMKVRRRQSDARWRANVAACYEKLRHVVRVKKDDTKKHISKVTCML